MREKLVAGVICLALSVTLMGCPLFESPESAFTATPTEGNAPLTVLFVDQSQPGSTDLTNWLWDFGDGLSSTAQNPSHVYSAPGVYRVTLTVTSRLGNDTETKIDYITVRKLPDADFTASPQAGEGPLQVTFTDASIAGAAPITLYEWDFGDGNTSEDVNPVHIYEDPGTYTVKLKVTTAIGDNTETKANLINVQERATASFTASPRAGASPLAVQFTDTSDPGSSPITQWFWDFGDGTSDTRQNPQHTYTAAGAYTVSLSVTTAVGQSPIASQLNFIEVEELPKANFSASPTSGPAPLNVNFTDLSSGGSDVITEWLWDFGDSTSSTLPSPSHRYASDGVYDVSLTVTTSSGKSHTLTKAGFITAQQSPNAAFSATPRNGEAPLTVQFTDLSDPGSAPITSWQWDFGDGSTSVDRNPFHSYTRPGRYTVTLGVSTAVGSDTATQVNYITVEQKPVAAFTATPTSGAAPLTVVFADQSTPGSSEITTWAWDFGDGTSSSQQNPSKTYNQPGVYTVKLTVTSAAGTGTITKANHITVRQLPSTDFTSNVTTGSAPLTVLFADESTSGSEALTGWQWDFGDGTTSGLQNPSKVYATPGIYTVSLTASSSVGSDTETKSAYLTVRPAVNFTASPTTGAGSLSVSFVDTTPVGSLNVTSRSWNFGDGSAASTEAGPVHIYSEPGIYDVTLTLQTSLDGQTDSRTKSGLIIVRPQPAFSANVVQGDGSLQVNFTDETELGSLDAIGVLWNFGDGTTSQTANPSHTYTEPGTYTVTLTVTTAAGSQTATQSNLIVVRPIPAFSANLTAGPPPLTTAFTNLTDLGGLTITGRLWDFGDGTTSEAASPIHAYTDPGNYDVTLTLTTSQGVVTTTVADYIQVAPVVAFTTDVSSGAAPLSVQFTDATDPGSLTITGYSWDFGDGTAASTDQNPFHTYTTGGSFDVSLTVTTAQGNRTFVDQDAIVVTPIIKIVASVVGGKSGENGAVSFADATDVGGVTVLGRVWNFGDGSEASAEDSPVHAYDTPGAYDVSLDLLTSLGPLSGTVERLVEVPPAPTFTVDQSEGTAPLKVSFTDTTAMGTLSLVGRTWNYGDGTSDSTGTHTYETPGTYEVTLKIATELGSARSTATTINVGINPLAAWFDGRESETGHAWIPVPGGYMLVGTADTGRENGLDVILVATDADAKALPGWPRYYGGAGDQQGLGVAATRDGGYVIVGESSVGDGLDSSALLLKIDGVGELLWNRQLGGTGDDRAIAVVELRSGDLALAGASNSPGSNGGFDAFVILTDALGENEILTWHGGPHDDEAVDIDESPDGSLVLTVDDISGAKGRDYLLRLNPDLSVP